MLIAGTLMRQTDRWGIGRTSIRVRSSGLVRLGSSSARIEMGLTRGYVASILNVPRLEEGLVGGDIRLAKRFWNAQGGLT